MDDAHNITSMTLYVTGEKVFAESKTEKCYIGGLKVLNQNMSRDRLYPYILGYTDQPERLWSLLGMLDTISICPVAFEIFERLKKEYGFRRR